jgi:hypothetical protein
MFQVIVLISVAAIDWFRRAVLYWGSVKIMTCFGCKWPSLDVSAMPKLHNIHMQAKTTIPYSGEVKDIQVRRKMITKTTGLCTENNM